MTPDDIFPCVLIAFILAGMGYMLGWLDARDKFKCNHTWVGKRKRKPMDLTIKEMAKAAKPVGWQKSRSWMDV